MKRKTSTLPTRIWKFAARLEAPREAHEILWQATRYYNRLVEIERARHARFAAIRRTYAPDLAAPPAPKRPIDSHARATP